MFKKPLYFYKAVYLETGRKFSMLPSDTRLQLSSASQWQKPACLAFLYNTSATQQSTATASGLSQVAAPITCTLAS